MWLVDSGDVVWGDEEEVEDGEDWDGEVSGSDEGVARVSHPGVGRVPRITRQNQGFKFNFTLL